MDEDDGTALMSRDPGATAVLDPRWISARSTSISARPADAPDNSPTTRDTMKTERMPQLSNLEPVTMSEVGTKLDLARLPWTWAILTAPATSCRRCSPKAALRKKQEARRLIDDTLPGA